MTVTELIAMLKKYPGKTEVRVAQEKYEQGETYFFVEGKTRLTHSCNDPACDHEHREPIVLIFMAD